MKQNKRALSILLSLCIFISALLTGCMSDQEKQKASENIALAKPIIKSFIDTYYNGAEINDVKCATYTGGSVFPTTIASDFVRAEVKYNNKKFYVMADVETSKCYTDYYRSEFIEDIKNYVISKTKVPSPDSYEIVYSNNAIGNNIYKKGYFFIEYGISDFETLLKSSNHTISILFNYKTDEYNLKKAKIDSLFKECQNNHLDLSFINYCNASRYQSYPLICNETGTISLHNSDAMFIIKNARIANTNTTYIDDEEVIDNDNYNDKYYEIAHSKKNGIEFAWCKSDYSINFSTVSAIENPNPETYNSSDKKYKYVSKDGTAIQLDITAIFNEEKPQINTMYYYFDNSLSGYYMLTFDDFGDIRSNDKISSSKSGNYTTYISAKKLEPQTIKLGIYKRLEMLSDNK